MRLQLVPKQLGIDLVLVYLKRQYWAKEDMLIFESCWLNMDGTEEGI